MRSRLFLLTSLLVPLTATINAQQQPKGVFTADTDAKLAHYYRWASTGTSISDRIKSSSAQTARAVVITMSPSTPPSLHVDSNLLPQGISPVILSEIANADLIVIGTPARHRSLPIADASFLFSEYSFHVDRVLFDSKNSIISGDTVIVSRPGGRTMIGGREIAAIDPTFEPFGESKRYLLFLRSIADVDAFQAVGSGSLLLDHGVVTPCLHGAKLTDVPATEDRLIADVMSQAVYIHSGSH